MLKKICLVTLLLLMSLSANADIIKITAEGYSWEASDDLVQMKAYGPFSMLADEMDGVFLETFMGIDIKGYGIYKVYAEGGKIILDESSFPLEITDNGDDIDTLVFSLYNDNCSMTIERHDCDIDGFFIYEDLRLDLVGSLSAINNSLLGTSSLEINIKVDNGTPVSVSAPTMGALILLSVIVFFSTRLRERDYINMRK